ncbi:MAG: phospholipid carrier-dependent glycosyltransferase, partial [Thermanaerothrix sp.]|nr:phospholipid carrier-dependent glycosyltransferase [Thermanaerothrix sp.]
MAEESVTKATSTVKPRRLFWDVLLFAILLIGAYFRLIGLDWDEEQHLHPDERFMTMVASSIHTPESVGDYFNTATSPLNPHVVGYGFYVYGTLPLFLTRWVGEALGKTGYGEIYLIGRVLSALADLFTVFLVYHIARHLYRRYAIGALAAGFAALAVLQIQLSHYFTVDTFANAFLYLSFYAAVRVMTAPLPSECQGPTSTHRLDEPVGFYLLFGLGLGLALASKVSTLPVAILLPIAVLIRYSRITTPEIRGWLRLGMVRNLALAVVVAFFTFRVFQPYAFSGPGFWGLAINPRWVDNLRELSNLSNGDVDFPPALQWARRPVTFAWLNMVKWGLGWPLGLLAWAGFLWMGYRIIRGAWREHLLLWAWTGLYFSWQSLNFTRAMRYQLPVYPSLAIIGAWAVITLWNKAALNGLFS